MRLNVILLILGFVPSFAFASDGYKCEIKQALGLSDEGGLTKGGVASAVLEMNSTFIVDRGTGRLIGSKGFSNENGQFGQPQVIDDGSSEQSFKVLTIYKPRTSVAFLEIREFEKSKKKPFIYFGAGLIVSGICEAI